METTATTDLAAADATTLSLNEDSPIDDFAAAYLMVGAVKDRVKEIEQQLKAAALERCEKHGPMLIGTKKLYAGRQVDTKCLNVPETLRAILQHSGGDEDAAMSCLASDAIKPGATRKILPPDVFEALFVVTDRTLLKTGDPTKRDLIELDTRFLR